jgi:hypothetical protein
MSSSSDTAKPGVPGNREPSMEKALEETRQPITPGSPVVDPGKPVGPNDGPVLTDGAATAPPADR